MTDKLKPYPSLVCQECGSKASKRGQKSISCWHEGKCDICEKEKSVTEPRDFFYPKFEGYEI
jgi:hypothetical protein